MANTSSYEECVLECANMGRDTDTVAAVAGGLAGIVYGYDGIPADWIEKLRGKEIIEECLFEKELREKEVKFANLEAHMQALINEGESFDSIEALMDDLNS